MKLSQVKQALETANEVKFQLPNGRMVPAHCHVTEIGKVDKQFIDCGGTLRKENVISFQLWYTDDHDHRLFPNKLKDIITISERVLALEDREVEVEYQGDTIGRYGLDFEDGTFILITKTTNCLAPDKCATSVVKPKVRITTGKMDKASSCTPDSGCC